MKKFWVVCWLGFLRKTNCVEKMVANCYGILLLIIGRGGTANIVDVVGKSHVRSATSRAASFAGSAQSCAHLKCEVNSKSYML